MNSQDEKELPPLPIETGYEGTQPQVLRTCSTPSKPRLDRLKTKGTLYKNPELSHSVCEDSSQGLSLQNTNQGLRSRRPGPVLTLNLQNNHLNSTQAETIDCDNGSHSYSTRSPFDSTLLSPAPFSASSAEDGKFFLPGNGSSDILATKILTPTASNSHIVHRNLVIKQQSSNNIMSAKTLCKDEEKGKLNSKTLDRRNTKKLTLNTIVVEKETAQQDSHFHKLDVKDPERKIDANELIENIKNLELGLEYQMPISADELVALKKLGSGQSGTVNKVLHLPSQKIMARKTVHLEAKEVIQSQIMRELRIMHECDSPFIIEFYGTFLQEGNVVICMEYADCGSLAQVFKIAGPFPEFMLKHVAYSVLSGLIYLYDNHRIIHRDVKPSNVLLTSKGRIKLCDFGVSRELINSLADTFVGTSTYMSPERIQGGVYSVKGDVWSLGIMLYELASGKLAFTNDTSGQTSILELLQRIVNEQPPCLSVKEGFSCELSDFVSLCLKKENQRPTPSALMSHPFLAGFLEEDGIRISSKYRSDIRKWSKNVRRVQKGKPIRDD